MVERVWDFGPGRTPVATAAEPAAQLGCIDGALTANADLGEPGADLLEDDCHLEPGEAVQGVDDVLRLGHDGAGLTQHAASHLGPCQLSAQLDLHTGDRQSAQLDSR